MSQLRPLSVAACLLASVAPLLAQSPGETKVAKWKDDKKAVFLLMFDDGWPSGWQIAVPALSERQMIATFYICPDKGEYKKFEETWLTDVVQAGMVLADHTMTHKGVHNLEEAEYEIGEAANYIRMSTKIPDSKPVSFGMPGVGKDDWEITGDELNSLLKKHNLISRPTFVGHGANYHVKTTEEMLALADKAIGEGGMEYLVIHGLERLEPNWGYQDFWALKQDIFFPLLDGLKERRDRGDLWITDHISEYQYDTERQTAKANVIFAKADGIRLELKCEADAKSYDYPLTLITAVPTTWKEAEIKQGEKLSKVKANQGAIMFEAAPNGGFIDIRAAQ